MDSFTHSVKKIKVRDWARGKVYACSPRIQGSRGWVVTVISGYIVSLKLARDYVAI